ncbi:MAG: hypothetical protein AABZ06_14840 [Bdellovibrionota bacterium]
MILLLIGAIKARRSEIFVRPKTFRGTMRRGDNYDRKLSTKLKSKRFAQNYIEALMDGEDGLSVQGANGSIRGTTSSPG